MTGLHNLLKKVGEAPFDDCARASLPEKYQRLTWATSQKPDDWMTESCFSMLPLLLWMSPPNTW
jgi:hypothetical protein